MKTFILPCALFLIFQTGIVGLLLDPVTSLRTVELFQMVELHPRSVVPDWDAGHISVRGARGVLSEMGNRNRWAPIFCSLIWPSNVKSSSDTDSYNRRNVVNEV